MKLIDVDSKTGKLKLSRKVLLEKPEGYVEPVRQPRRNNDRNDRNSNNRNNRPRRRE